MHCEATEFSLACAATAADFERVFGVRVVLRPCPTTGSPVTWEGEIRIPEEIAEFVEQVTFPVRPEFF